MTGPLNLRLNATDKWNIFKDLASKVTQGSSGGSIHTSSNETVHDTEALKSLDLMTVPQNKELGAIINRLYDGPFGQTLRVQSDFDDAKFFPVPGSTIGTNRSHDNQFKSADGAVTGLSQQHQTSQLSQQKQSSLSVASGQFPMHHPVKLCLLGSVFSGKKSLA